MAANPLIAVVIPVYRQSQFLKDAVLSALSQSLRRQLRVIIVNDGCPHASTDWLGKYFVDAFPGEVFYLKQPNQGPSAARNYGIRLALATWPSLQAVFPLDTDNRLAPTTLEILWGELASAGPSIGWVYQDTVLFGTRIGSRCWDLQFNTYRLLYENYCDAGSLIHRRVFDSGVLFDEVMTRGYEDWEFFIAASLRGFQGVHAANTGFHYREREHSHNKGAQQEHHAIQASILAKHAGELSHEALIRLEHREMPRYALISSDGSDVGYFTDPAAPRTRTLTLARFADDLACWANEPVPQSTYVPPIILCADTAILRGLDHLRLLPSLLFDVQSQLAINGSTWASIDLAHNPVAITMDRPANPTACFLFATTARSLVENARAGATNPLRIHGEAAAGDSGGLALSVGRSFLEGESGALLAYAQSRTRPATQDMAAKIWTELLSRLRATRAPAAHADDEVHPVSHTDFAIWKHVEQRVTTFPYCPSRQDSTQTTLDIAFVVPWLRMGGADLCVVNLARALAGFGQRYRIHLVITDENLIEANPASLIPFDTVAWLPAASSAESSSRERERSLLTILAHADVIINNNSRLCYELLPEIKRHGHAKVFSYLHAVNFHASGEPYGYPLLASRHCEGLLDGFLLISQHLRRFCLNLGVPEEKIVVMPNAPAVAPPDSASALAIAQQKCARRYSPGRPLRILFTGRFDYQKAVDRLGRIAETLSGRGVPFELRMVGKLVLDAPAGALVYPNTTVLPPVFNEEKLAAYYTEADVFLRPSQWEGVPLSILEAMAFGNIVIATDVGAVSEAVANGRTGFLLDPSQPENSLTEEAYRIIASVVENPARYDEMRLAACRRALEWSWERSAEILAAEIDHLTLH